MAEPLPGRPVTVVEPGRVVVCACHRELAWQERGGDRAFAFLWAWCPVCLLGYVHADHAAGYRAWVAAVSPEPIERQVQRAFERTTLGY